MLGDYSPASAPAALPPVAAAPEATPWLHEQALRPFLDEIRAERLAEVERVAEHVELSLTELLHIQQVAPVVAEEEHRTVVITVYTFYFQEEETS